jgi:hypothetical protein
MTTNHHFPARPALELGTINPLGWDLKPTEQPE